MHILKRAAAAVMALTMVASLTACSGSYEKDVEAIMDEVNTNNTASLDVDWTDAAQVQAYVETNKATYQKFIDLKAPSKFEESHGKLVEAAEGMIEYLDALPELFAMDTSSPEYDTRRTELVNIYSTAFSKLAEGLSGLDISQNKAGDEAPAEPSDTAEPAEETTPNTDGALGTGDAAA